MFDEDIREPLRRVWCKASETLDHGNESQLDIVTQSLVTELITTVLRFTVYGPRSTSCELQGFV